MESQRGTIKMEFEGRIISFEYSIYNLFGNINIAFEDRHGRHHHFFNANGKWKYGLNKGPYWREGFLLLLYQAFDEVMLKHDL